jgi:hypothetical protein
MKGLELHNVLGVLRSNPNQARKLLQGNMQPLTAEILDNIFEPELSPAGNVKREKRHFFLTLATS